MNPDDAMLLNYQMTQLPQTILINPSGEIVYRQFGPIESETFESTLQILMIN